VTTNPRHRRPTPPIHREFLPRLMLVKFMEHYWNDPTHTQDCADFRAQNSGNLQAFVLEELEREHALQNKQAQRAQIGPILSMLAPGTWNPFTWGLIIRSYYAYAGESIRPAAQAYANATHDFLASWGLDLLPDYYPYVAARIIPKLPQRTYYDTFEIGKGHGLWTLMPPTSVGEPFADPSNIPENLPISITIEGERDWKGEKRGDTVKRLQQQFDKQLAVSLDAQDAMITAKGFVFSDTKPKQHLYLHWLYRRVAYRESCVTIAIQATKDARKSDLKAPVIEDITVRKRTDELGKTIG